MSSNNAGGAGGYEEASPGLMDLEEVGEEDDFEFPSMPRQAPIQHLRDVEERMSERRARARQQMTHGAASG